MQDPSHLPPSHPQQIPFTRAAVCMGSIKLSLCEYLMFDSCNANSTLLYSPSPPRQSITSPSAVTDLCAADSQRVCTNTLQR